MFQATLCPSAGAQEYYTVAAITVYRAPEDGHKGRPKHVEHTCSF